MISGVGTGHSSNGGAGDQGTTLSRQLRGVFIARVVRVEAAHGTHIVWVATKSHARLFPAKVLMPFVSPNGLGLLAGIVKNSSCLVAASSNEAEYFVLGFFSPDPAVLYDVPIVQSGDVHLASSGGAVISSLASGDINLHAHHLCGMSMFQEDQRITVIDRTFEHKHAAGKTTWGEATEDDAKHSEGDTWTSFEARRERGKPVVIRQTYGNVKASDDTELVSQREILDETGKQLLLEEIETDGTITIKHPQGALFRLKADGNVFVEPKSGGTIHLSDLDQEAKGAARIGDATEPHSHVLALTFGGPYLVNVTMADASPKIQDGSTVVKVG
jgi:hypothetical protein